MYNKAIHPSAKATFAFYALRYRSINIKYNSASPPGDSGVSAIFFRKVKSILCQEIAVFSALNLVGVFCLQCKFLIVGYQWYFH